MSCANFNGGSEESAAAATAASSAGARRSPGAASLNGSTEAAKTAKRGVDGRGSRLWGRERVNLVAISCWQR